MSGDPAARPSPAQELDTWCGENNSTMIVSRDWIRMSLDTPRGRLGPVYGTSYDDCAEQMLRLLVAKEN